MKYSFSKVITFNSTIICNVRNTTLETEEHASRRCRTELQTIIYNEFQRDSQPWSFVYTANLFWVINVHGRSGVGHYQHMSGYLWRHSLHVGPSFCTN